MDAATTRANTAPFVLAVRAVVGPKLPIVIVEPTDFRPSWLLGDVNNVTGAWGLCLMAFTSFDFPLFPPITLRSPS